MTTIEPGTPVTVVMLGIMRQSSPPSVDGTDGSLFMGLSESDAVRIVPFDRERPTLDRKTIALAVRSADHAWTMGSSLKTHETWTGHLADAILNLIEAAHPGLIR